MNKLAQLVINKICTAVAIDRGYVEHLHRYQYYCTYCEQVFFSDWGCLEGFNSWCEKGAYFYCTNCGRLHKRENVIQVSNNEMVPITMALSVDSYKDKVKLIVRGLGLYFLDSTGIREPEYKEVFTFDIKSGKVTFDSGKRRPPSAFKGYFLTLGNPFNLTFLDSESVLFHLATRPVLKDYKSKISEVMKILREDIHSKMEKKHKHKIKSMYVSQGEYGSMILPIFNIAFRMSYPDIENLPAAFRSYRKIEEHLKAYKIDSTQLSDQKFEKISDLIKLLSIPDTPFVRNKIQENILNINPLKKAFLLSDNYDNALRIFELLNQYEGYQLKTILPFMKEMKSIYDSKDLIKILALDIKCVSRLQDTIRMYNTLTDDNLRVFSSSKIRVKDMHDWLMVTTRLQNYHHIDFKVPEHVYRRLSMQIDSIKFFIPEKSEDLVVAGAKLNNCVASYAERMGGNELQIVLVTDDAGKLVACLEVSNNRKLIQAKLNHNKPVSNNAKINAEVIKWAQKAGVDFINCEDVRKIYLPVVISA